MARSDYWSTKQLLTRSRFSRRSLLTGGAAVGVGAAGLALVGCGDDDDAAGSPTAQTGGSPTPVAAVRGGTLRMMDSIGGAVFDPAATTHAGALWMGPILVYDYINRYTKNFEVQAHMGSLPEQPNDTTLIYRIKPGIKWQDKAPLNGRPFTAKDAAFGFRRFTEPNPEFIFGTRFSLIDKFEAVDDTTLRVTMKEPYAAAVLTLAEDNMVMVSEEAHQRFDSAQLKQFQNMIGTGAFIPDSFTEAVKTRLVRNPNYWQEGKPYVDAIEITQITDPALREAAMVSGQVDMNAGWGAGTTLQQADAVKSRLADKVVLEPKALVGRSNIHFHAQKSPFTDPRVRRALHLAVDRQAIFAAAQRNHLLMGPLTQSSRYGFTEQDLLGRPGYRADKKEDLAEAKRLLTAAGFANGFSTEITGGGGPDNEVLQQNWKQIGVEAKLRVIPTAERPAVRSRGDFEVLAISLTSAGDPDQPLYGECHSKGGMNWGKFSNADVDKLSEQQRRIFDFQQRKKVTDELQNLLLELSPQAWTFSFVFYQMMWSHVKNFTVTPGYQGWVLADTYIDKRS